MPFHSSPFGVHYTGGFSAPPPRAPTHQLTSQIFPRDTTGVCPRMLTEPVMAREWHASSQGRWMFNQGENDCWFIELKNLSVFFAG